MLFVQTPSRTLKPSTQKPKPCITHYSSLGGGGGGARHRGGLTTASASGFSEGLRNRHRLPPRHGPQQSFRIMQPSFRTSQELQGKDQDRRRKDAKTPCLRKKHCRPPTPSPHPHPPPPSPPPAPAPAHQCRSDAAEGQNMT